MDVSDEGYEGFILRKISSAKFEKYEKDTSSTFTELISVKYVLISFDSILKNQSVQVILDNSSACRIYQCCSKPRLQSFALDSISN